MGEELDPEEEMRRKIDELDLPAPSNDTCVQLLNEAELSSRLNKVTQELLRRGEALNPTTQTGRDLHSERSAYLLEMQRRRMR